MRRTLRGFRLEKLEEALKECGYVRAAHEGGFYRNYWKKDRFYIILHPTLGRGVVLHIQRYPSHKIGPTQTAGKDLEEEVERVIQTYTLRRERAKVLSSSLPWSGRFHTVLNHHESE